MSVFQYLAAVDGYSKANDPEDEKKLTPGEQDDLWAWIQE